MWGLLSLEIVMNLMCFASFKNESLHSTCNPGIYDLQVSPNKTFSMSDICMTTGCPQTDADILVDLRRLDNFLKNASDCTLCLTPECFQTDLLERNLPANAKRYIRMTKEMYDSCMDLQSIEQVDSEPLKKVLKEFGGWPTVEENVDQTDREPLTDGLKDLRLAVEESSERADRELRRGGLKDFKDKLAEIGSTDQPDRELRRGGLKDFKDKLAEIGSTDQPDREPPRKGWKDFKGLLPTRKKSWDPTSFDWMDTLIKMRKKGFNHNIFMSLSVTKDGESHYLELDQPSLGIAREHLISGLLDDVKYAYFQLMLKAAYILIYDDEKLENYILGQSSLLSKELREVLDFETYLAKISTGRQKGQQPPKLRFTVKELQKEVPEVKLLFYKTFYS
ncbi:uncharacterized protein LOC118204338 isoform X2 [Stegodyphus dumicola]|uniref:uncharacterized protein LOC118204338 isoform X2 n=1 Tax=Stegodyphus dumicola TaxID=202533 RepID=UPI0015A9C459|nr:uncharacterized protein LOC118204338 isoform X2 [Stegodyphus dumicola]